VRRLMLLMAAMGATVLLASGIAYAFNEVQCDSTGDQDPDTGQCRGTAEDDIIAGTGQADTIFALNGYDAVRSGTGKDELRGGALADSLAGNGASDTYFGGKGSDFFIEDENGIDTGNDEMNGGPGSEFMIAGDGNDILRGQAGDESEVIFPPEEPVDIEMIGGRGDDILRGGTGDDAMEGDEGTDELHGGPDADFIDAEDFTRVDRPDLVDGGDGFDTCRVNGNDIIVPNTCERIESIDPPTATSAAGAR
jgi:Ca2+-binding RTX toxin-like protein